jgi:hypothetical protein
MTKKLLHVGISPNIGNYIYIYIYIYIYTHTHTHTILGLHIMFCKFVLQNVKWKSSLQGVHRGFISQILGESSYFLHFSKFLNTSNTCYLGE